MRKIKKFLMAVAIASTVAAGLYGCGQTGGAGDSAVSKSSDSKESKNSSKDSGSSEKADENDEAKAPEFKTDATIESTVLLDQDGIRITAQELTYTGNSPELSLLLENNTDKNLNFVCGSIGYSVNSVNGYMFPDIYVNSDITAGNQSNETIDFNYQELQLYGINEIAEIQIGFDITDDDYNDVLETGPLQIKTSAFDNYDFTKDTVKEAMSNSALLQSLDVTLDYSSEDELYNDGGVTSNAAFALTNKSGDKQIFVEAYNSGSSPVYVSISDIEANGIVVSDGRWTAEYVNPQKYVLLNIDLNQAIENGGASVDAADVNELKFKMVLLNEKAAEVSSEKEVTLTMGAGETTAKVEGQEVYNQNGIKFTFAGMNTDKNDDTHFTFYIENSSGKNIDVNLDGLALNGTMVSALENCSVEDGKTGTLDVELMEFQFDNAKLKPEDVTKAEFTFEIKDDNYDTIDKPVIDVDIKQ